MERLVIIDGKSVYYRGYYAMGALSMSDGTPTGAVYGFAAIAMEIVKNLKPTKVVVAWDSRSSTSKRKAVFSEYKAGRAKPGEDFYAQIPLLEELVKALGWSFIECEDYEADDIIGTLSRQADEDLDETGKCRWMTYIVSSDQDMFQIVDENTRMYRILKGFSELEEVDVRAIEEKYGIKKAQFLDLKALKGDSSDNIPGVPGVGEKTAVKLLGEYGSVAGVYQALDEKRIWGKVAEKLTNGRESARMSYFLAKIMTDAPVSLKEVPELKVDGARIRAALEKLEFRSLIAKYKKEGILDAVPAGGYEVFEGGAAEGGFGEVGVSGGAGSSGASKPSEGVEGLEDVILSWDIKALMHEDGGVAEKILAGAKYYDLGQGAFLLNPLAREIEKGDEKAEYARQQREFKEKPQLYKIFVQFDLPLIPVLYKVEKEGMLLDREYFERLKDVFSEFVAGKEQEVCEMAGAEFNLNSPTQLSEVLFEKMGLPTKGIKKTSRGYSTGAKELKKLEGQHPIIEQIKIYRETAKLLSTYISPLPELADEAGRVHTTFTQNVTATGRLSSTNPNMQNIPVRTEIGKKIREGFIAGPGKVLVNADYSQFELRLAAALANDQGLMEDFNRGLDIHSKTAADAFGVPLEQVTKEQRRAAKVINFGVLYGMSVNGLAGAAGMKFYEAKQFIERYFELRAPMKVYLEKVLEQARTLGYVETFYGRRRPTPDVKSSNFLIRTAAERAAQNMPIQGTEADLMKRAMIEIDRLLPEGAKMVMQVHDSIMVECAAEQGEEIGRLLQTTMEGVAPELPVKLKVDIGIGQNWGEI